jgi:hypothetical protein
MAALKRKWKDGIIAGLLGGAGVAVWFLIVDLIDGRPLFTPSVLGRALLSVLDHGIEGHNAMFFVVVYTVFHFVAFAAIGCLASVVMTATIKAPQYTAGLLLCFAVFEVAFYFLALMLSSGNILGSLAWYQIGAANLVAATLTGGYLLKRHPEFTANLDHALDGSS